MTGGSQSTVFSQITVNVPSDLGLPFKITNIQLDTDGSLPLATLERHLPGARGLFYTSAKDKETTAVLIDNKEEKLIFPPTTEVSNQKFEVYLRKVVTTSVVVEKSCCPSRQECVSYVLIFAFLLFTGVVIYFHGSQTKDFSMFTAALSAWAGLAGISMALMAFLFFIFDNVKVVLAKVDVLTNDMGEVKKNMVTK